MPDKTFMFDRAIPVLASLEIATSLDFFHKLGFETHDFGAACKTLIDSERRKNTQTSNDVRARQLARF